MDSFAGVDEKNIFALLNSLQAFVYIVDMDTYEIMFLNRYAKNKFGDVTGKVCYEHIFTDTKGVCAHCNNERLLKQPDNEPIEFEYYSSDDNRWYRCIDTMIVLQIGKAAKLRIQTDITETKIASEQAQKRKKYLDSITFSVMELLTSDNLSIAVRRTLALLGTSFSFDAISIFENTVSLTDDTLHISKILSWSRDKYDELAKEDLKDISFETLLAEWKKLLLAGEVVIISSEAQAKCQSPLISKEAELQLLIPIIIKKDFWGLLIIEDSGREKKLRGEEEELLKTVATLLGASLTNEKYKIDSEKAREYSDKANRAKSEFLASMSHEIRTPLNSILGYAQMLKEEHTLDEKQTEAIDIIGNSGNHLLSLVNDILDLSKIEANMFEFEKNSFSFSDMLTNLEAMARVKAQNRGLTFKTNFQETLPTKVMGDQRRLSQVLLNILSNAISYTNEGTVHFDVSFADDEFIFRIKDSGIGIPENKIQEIFKPFRQLKSDSSSLSKGSGLGLTISKELIQRMGGTLEVKSKLNEGTEFTIKLTLEIAELLPSKPIPKHGKNIAGYEGDRKKILIIDDQKENRKLLAMILRKVGFQVESAENGEEGVVKALKMEPDLVFMDLIMPEMDGFEATKYIKQAKNLKHTSVVAVSASVFEKTVEQSKEAGCDEFIQKPVKLDELFDIMEKILNLNWIYKAKPKTTNQAIIATEDIKYPDRQIMLVLHRFAVQGDMSALLTKLEEVVDSDSDLEVFASNVRHFAKAFKLKQLREYLTNSLKLSS